MKQTQNSLPEWYWTHGLHDANIVSATIKESDWNGDNCLILKIDCEGALYEADITEIRFYNYNFKSGYYDINLLNGGWWLSDEITRKGTYYFLELEFDTSECKRKRLEITFQRAEVIKEQNIC